MKINSRPMNLPPVVASELPIEMLPSVNDLVHLACADEERDFLTFDEVTKLNGLLCDPIITDLLRIMFATQAPLDIRATRALQLKR